MFEKVIQFIKNKYAGLKTTLSTVGGSATFLWYGLAILFALIYIRSLFGNADEMSNGILIFCIDLAKAVLVLVLLLILFRLIHLACARASTCGEKAKKFPSHATIFVGIWLVVLAALSVLGLYVAFLPKALQRLLCPLDDGTVPQIMESLVMMFAAGVGSCISTILGYLLHASQEKDFDVAYIPWYFARPLMGMLLGLIFYFVIKGGLLVLTVGESASGEGGLNLWSLAAVGALVGLFSKNAIEKLREVFNTLFRTQRDLNQELLSRLPDDLKDKVSPYLELPHPDEKRVKREIISRLPDDLKSKVLACLEGTGEQADEQSEAGELPKGGEPPKGGETPEAVTPPEAETPPEAGTKPEAEAQPEAGTEPEDKTPPDQETP